MESDGGFVENIKHSAKPRADLRREPNALAFAAGQRVGGPVEAQVVQPNGVEKLEAIPNLPNDSVCDQPFSNAQV